MRLTDIDTPLPVAMIGQHAGLVTEIQARLGELGLLDPPSDGTFGPVSRWALGAFCERAGTPLGQGLTPQVARALLDARADSFLPMNPKADLAGRIVRAMVASGYWIARHPRCFNIVYLEGADPDGTPNDNKPNRFNDLRVLISVRDGVPVLAGRWEGTTEPGKRWTISPITAKGAARIQFGQWKAWAVGTHHPDKPSRHEALVQVGAVTVHRDLNKDYKRSGDKVDTGLFYINQHWGYDYPVGDMGESSAGCLVGRTRKGHREFMALVKSDPRYVANNGYRFMSTVMPVSSLGA